ncbi:TonB C-terminal domain-containing protein [Pseudoxanthomonas japonensis]|uniref:TonB C-terminal domain-containing protein n=1 Tax=Pseudoxanthomonas japonensis TaxID=69284 RepID=A0ABQ6ZFT5_9GAMM|nr:TonB C-terminal domain-containing protein [Pseudoxanthomonas japonensis]KAF1724386.1 hypothetical protein CSC78_12910 [Pseudoxanthomonas japonensis]
MRHVVMVLLVLLTTSAYAQPVSEDADLHRAYSQAVRQAIRTHWTPPDAGVTGACPVLVRQLPGGEVLHVEAHHGCAFDEAGRRSVEDAVWAASPLPYHGYERVFAREMRVTVRADGE